MKSIHTQHNKAFPETGFRYLSYEGMSSCGVMGRFHLTIQTTSRSTNTNSIVYSNDGTPNPVLSHGDHEVDSGSSRCRQLDDSTNTPTLSDVVQLALQQHGTGSHLRPRRTSQKPNRFKE
ncbi:hypothetical protein L1987_47033 [Smallanthus sonchifolius]|uniref:Uncharacterized protein n=1 Tax=Smallanthus sonchifolius TaxID=185202 RepID=A0ACB9G2E9_9ASTR|nr:hypothetical protein L1987_47033 [Smallanthus sonchifolius]